MAVTSLRSPTIDRVTRPAGGDLTADDRRLIRRYQDEGDRAALEELLVRHMGVVRSLAMRYRNTREPREDLMQVACLAFVAAVKRFDPDRGQSLRAFVIPSILGSLRRHFRDATWSVHVTRRLQERGRVAQEALRVLGNHNGRTPDVDEVAAEIGVTREEALEALAVHSAYRAGSLDTLTDEWRDLVSFEEARYENVAERIALSRALAMLSPRDRAIVTLRFGLDMTQSEIGARMGISQMHVSRILRRSLEQMSHVLADTDSAT